MQNEKEKRRIKISPARVLIIVLSGLLMGLCVYVINANLFAGNSMPMPFGVGAGVVLSGSMEPELSVDDLIIVRKAGEYSVGDVVVYRSGRMSVVHRIVSADEKTVVTKGDANNAADAPISPSDIDGRVVCSIPKAGVVVDFLRTPLGVVIILGAAFLLLELSFRREQTQGNREIEEIRAEIVRLRNSQQDEEQTDENSTELK